MLQQQFDQLMAITKELVYQGCEVVENKIIKKSYYRQGRDNSDKVIEECHEFYLESDKIVEKITKRKCDFVIFSKNQFVLPEGCSFGDPIEENHKYYDNLIKLAFQMGRDSKKNFSELSPVKWKTLGEITKELEFILREGGGYVMTHRKPDIAYFSFQNEHYFVTYYSPGYTPGYTLGKRDSLADIGRQKTGTSYGTAMELVLAVGIHKFQFGISHNGGD